MDAEKLEIIFCRIRKMFIILCVLCKSVGGIDSVIADFAEHISFISNTKTADAFQLHPFLFNAITVYVLKASSEER